MSFNKKVYNQNYFKNNKDKYRQHKASWYMRNPLYFRWRQMMNRCNSIKNSSYKHYGARGIKVEPFLSIFANYTKYIMSLPNALEPGYSVDRINNDKGYIRDNLRWATSRQQTQNRRISKFGFPGVSSSLHPYRVYLYVNKKKLHFGSYKTPELAFAQFCKVYYKFRGPIAYEIMLNEQFSKEYL